MIGFVVAARTGMADDLPAGTVERDTATSRPLISPLERLRARSAAERWRKVSDEYRGSSRVGGGSETAYPPIPEPASIPPEPQQTYPRVSPEGSGAFDIEPRIEEPRRVAAAQQPPQPVPDTKYSEPVRSPRDLRKVTEILPFFDYEPDPAVAKDDPCLYRCPRPDGAPCKNYPPGQAPACPEEIKLSDETYLGRAVPETMVAWEASNLYHNPLYFEDAPLERYGHTHCCVVQPFASVGKFSLQLLGLPYQATIDPVCKEMYTLGWYRPGECAPKKCYQIPWNWDAAFVQAGATTGMVFFLP
jgi:hypothetical protein